MKLNIIMSQAGSLREQMLAQDPQKEANQLKLTGVMDKTDLFYLRLVTGKNGWIKELDMADIAGIETIAEHDFEFGSILTSIKLPKSLTEVGWGAFSMCSKLATVVFPAALQSIENFAFNGCTALKSVSLPKSLKNLGSYAFGDCLNLEEIKIPMTNTAYCSLDGVIYSKNGKVLVKYPSGKMDIAFQIPLSVNTIGENAFFMNEYLKDIILPPNLAEIHKNAFCSCSYLPDVVLPVSVKKIEEGAFCNCTSLLTLHVMATEPPALNPVNKPAQTLRIYVPLASAEVYRQSDAWNKLGDVFGK